MPNVIMALLPLIDVVQQTPPGSDKILQVLGWLAWVATAAGVIGLIIVGVRMGLKNHRGEGSDAAAGLGWVIAGLIIVASAGPIVNALI